MRNLEKYKRDTYYLNLTKEVCVFLMMAYSLSNEYMMEKLGPMFAVLAVAFMFTPRAIINDLFDRDTEGERETEQVTHPEWKRKMTVALNIIKFFCLVIMTLYMFLNTWMTTTFGTVTIWMACFFMVIPRKLINMLATDSYQIR